MLHLSPLVAYTLIVLQETMGIAFSDLTPAESEWIRRHLEEAVAIVSEHAPGDEWAPLRLEALDRAWSHWIRRADSYSSDEINRVLNGIGVAFGNALVETNNFEWVIASDDYGTDLAVVACRGRGDVTVYPTDFVGKRWDRREGEFLAHGYATILEHVQKTKDEWRAAGK